MRVCMRMEATASTDHGLVRAHRQLRRHLAGPVVPVRQEHVVVEPVSAAVCTRTQRKASLLVLGRNDTRSVKAAPRGQQYSI